MGELSTGPEGRGEQHPPWERGRAGGGEVLLHPHSPRAPADSLFCNKQQATRQLLQVQPRSRLGSTLVLAAAQPGPERLGYLCLHPLCWGGPLLQPVNKLWACEKRRDPVLCYLPRPIEGWGRPVNGWGPRRSLFGREALCQSPASRDWCWVQIPALPLTASDSGQVIDPTLLLQPPSLQNVWIVVPSSYSCSEHR